MNVQNKRNRPIVFANHKGGVWKTSSAIAICDIAQMSGLELQIFSIDHQARLLNYFDNVKEIHLPDSERLAEDDIADARALEAPLYWLLEPSEKLVVVDVGANNVSRLAQAALAIGFAGEVQAEYSPIVIIPTTSDPASLTAARESYEMLNHAFGEKTSFILGLCGNGFASNHKNEDFAILESQCEDSMKIRNMGSTTIRVFEQSGKLPSALANLSKLELAAAFNETPIAAAYLNNKVMLYMDGLITECQRVFKFHSEQDTI